jgi:hypothetical protein
LIAKFPLIATLFLLAAGMPWSAARAQPASPSPAPAQWVQVIVFRTLDPDAGDHERWSHRLPTKLMREGLQLRERTGESDAAFRPAPLGPKMQRVWAILRAAALYAPLLRVAWIQPALNFDSAIPVALNPVRARGTRTVGARVRTPPMVTHLSVPASRLATPLKPTVYGTVKITVLRHVYIAVHTVLIERKPAPAINRGPSSGRSSRITASGPILNVYPIHQANQVRPGRINYFDNPAYGVLVYVKAVPAAATPKPPRG